MNFKDSVTTCVAKFATFKGRASRSEFWWFYLFYVLVSLTLPIVESWIVGLGNDSLVTIFLFLEVAIFLGLVITFISVSCRRLHDYSKSGWWQLLYLTVIGALLLFYWFTRKGDDDANRYGDYIST